jgi:hypothetical protein
MVCRNRFRPAQPWLLTILVTLLVLGHACELPTYADLVISPHSTAATGHSADGHEHEPQISCDPVDVLSNTTHAQLIGPVLDVVQAFPVASPVPGWLVMSAHENSTRLPDRPPLFLLYASLLI